MKTYKERARKLKLFDFMEGIRRAWGVKPSKKKSQFQKGLNWNPYRSIMKG